MGILKVETSFKKQNAMSDGVKPKMCLFERFLSPILYIPGVFSATQYVVNEADVSQHLEFSFLKLARDGKV